MFNLWVKTRARREFPRYINTRDLTSLTYSKLSNFSEHHSFHNTFRFFQLNNLCLRPGKLEKMPDQKLNDQNPGNRSPKDKKTKKLILDISHIQDKSALMHLIWLSACRSNKAILAGVKPDLVGDKATEVEAMIKEHGAKTKHVYQDKFNGLVMDCDLSTDVWDTQRHAEIWGRETVQVVMRAANLREAKRHPSIASLTDSFKSKKSSPSQSSPMKSSFQENTPSLSSSPTSPIDEELSESAWFRTAARLQRRENPS